MAYGATQLNVSTQKVITHVITNQSEQYSYERSTEARGDSPPEQGA